jgi:oleate hydratase
LGFNIFGRKEWATSSGGIASVAAAGSLIRDGDWQEPTIAILEESSQICGSLDAPGNAMDGHVMRGAA